MTDHNLKHVSNPGSTNPDPPTTTSTTISSSSSSSPFDTSLPSELSLTILKTVHSPRDLYALIRASPGHYRVFRTYRPEILATVAARVFLPEIRPLALLVCEAQKELSCREVREKDRKTARERERERREATVDDKHHLNWRIEIYTLIYFCLRQLRTRLFAYSLEDIRASCVARAEDLCNDRAGAVKLCRLWWLIDFFVRDYVDYARSQETRIQRPGYITGKATAAKQERDIQVSIVPAKISPVEYGRLQRAFLHLELSRHLHDGSDRLYECSFFCMFRPRGSAMAGCITRFEFEELSSASEFLESRMRCHFDEIEKFAAAAQLKYAAAISTTGNFGSKNSNHGDSENGSQFFRAANKNRSFRHFRYESPIPRDNCYGTSSFASAIVELGLPFYRQFSQMGRAMQLRFIHDFTQLSKHYRPFESVNEMFTCSRSLHWPSERQQLRSSVTYPSPGYERIRRLHPGHSKEALSYLRRCGYLFWDSAAVPECIDGFSLTLKNISIRDPAVEKLRVLCSMTPESLVDILPPAFTRDAIVEMIERCE